MSLRLKLTLLLGGLVLATVLGAYVVTGRMVMTPFAKEVMRSHIDGVVFLVERAEQGEDPAALGERLGLDVRVRKRPPRLSEHGRRGRCTSLQVRGREVVACRGPKAPVAVESSLGWITVRRDLDPTEPGERAGRFLLLVAIGVLFISFFAAALATRPLSQMREAMSRVASGEIDHRLPEHGAKELADLARTFNAMTARLNEMLRAERALMAGISHEVRTPLARLRLELELIRDQGVSESRLTSMERDLEEIDALIGEMLETSRLAIGDRRLEREPVDLTSMTEEAVQRAAINSHPITISGHGGVVVGDRERLLRVLGNLLGNAQKYAPTGTPIEIELLPSGLRVADRGPGVPEDALLRIFEPFFRAKSPGLSKPGFGLGLSVAHQIITLHGGHVRARNRAGGGLEIEIDLESKRA
jgi:signal transduction histidine kinase